ncbi:MAG TPA: cobyric acid synthase [Candidatus Acidoferrum sp.]|nr:cobyric acid synthase [Candidatus Acidoferrum sp.]
MIQGTSSGVGKTVLTAALCRVLARAGFRVAPFKSQNMALNAAVTADGLEIGRAQAAQAEAAGIEPSVDMNPILLKPEGDDRSQVVVAGVPRGSFAFADYRELRAELMKVVEASLDRLRRAHDVVIIEGAGSPAEINLNDGEIVNMRIARLADAPVVLAGDIDRGGVFAAFIGTLALLDPEDRERVRALVINKFRGNRALLTSGLDLLTERTGRPVLGVVPYVEDVPVAAEDSLDLDGRHGPVVADIDVAVIRMPRIANFDDFEPLAREPRVRVRFVRDPAELAAADLIVLPGSKNTSGDLAWLRATGLAEAILGAARAGRLILGVCGGYQMLGETLRDPLGIESVVGEVRGLGLLPVVTTFAPAKTTVRVSARATAKAGVFAQAQGIELSAYEIHMGRTERCGGDHPFTVTERNGVRVDEADGAVNAAGNVLGTYLHGLFANDGLRRALLVELAALEGLAPDPRWGRPADGNRYDRLADVVAGALDLTLLARLLRIDPRRLSSS